MARTELNPSIWPKVSVHGEPLTACSWQIFPTRGDPRITGPQRSLLNRVFRLFQGLDILVVGELVKKSAEELVKYRGMGPNVIELIDLYLERNGLKLETVITDPVMQGRILGAAGRDKLPELEEFLMKAFNLSDVSDVVRCLGRGYVEGKGTMIPAHIMNTHQLQLFTREDLLAFNGMRSEWVNLIEEGLWSQCSMRLRD